MGSRKKGWPTRKLGTKPIAVSGTLEALAVPRGRFSREYVKWASFSMVLESVLNQLVFTAWIRDGPSVPFAVVPYVGTSNVWLAFLDQSKL